MKCKRRRHLHSTFAFASSSNGLKSHDIQCCMTGYRLSHDIQCCMTGYRLSHDIQCCVTGYRLSHDIQCCVTQKLLQSTKLNKLSACALYRDLDCLNCGHAERVRSLKWCHTGKFIA